jgi:hypothetical protein
MIDMIMVAFQVADVIRIVGRIVYELLHLVYGGL